MDKTLALTAVVAIGISLAVLLSNASGFSARVKAWVDVAPQLLSSDADRQNFYTYLLHDAELFGLNSSVNTEWLLGEAKSFVAQKIDAIKSYETKATTQFSIIGSGIGIVTVLGGSEVHGIPGYVWVVALGAAFLFASLICNIVCITRGRIDVLPYIDSWNHVNTLRDPRMKARMQCSLTEAYVTVSNDLAATCLQKQRMLILATGTFVFGLALVAGNYLLAAFRTAPASVPTQVHLVRAPAATMVLRERSET